MWRKVVWKGFVLLICVVAIVGGISLYDLAKRSQETGNIIFSLEIPSFIKTASASEFYGQREGTSFLQKEAGITAYVNVGESISIEEVEAAFKSIETVNDTYIIGEINITGTPEYAHPHAYVHEDGWIVAYYSKNAPASKIMQWNEYEGGTITTTTLEDAIHEICLAINIPFSTIEGNIKYYDFEYPNANRMMLIVETASGGINVLDSFNLEIPTECWLYEASWSHYFSGYMGWDGYSRIKIDEDVINEITAWDGTYFGYGILTPQQLETGVPYTISVEHKVGASSYISGVAILLIYRTP